jgi:hypothetical protein
MHKVACMHCIFYLQPSLVNICRGVTYFEKKIGKKFKSFILFPMYFLGSLKFFEVIKQKGRTRQLYIYIYL